MAQPTEEHVADGPTREPLYDSRPPTWTPDMVLRTVQQANLGEVAPVANLCDAILSDGRIRGVLQTRALALFGCKVEYEDGAGDGRRRGGVITALKDGGEYDALISEANAIRLFIFGLMTNCAPCELYWEPQVTGRPRMRVVPKHPRNLRFDQDLYRWRIATGKDAEEEDFLPGNGRWGLYQPFGTMNSATAGLWYPLALYWLSAAFADFEWTRRNEAKGRAALVGVTKDGVTKVDPDDVKKFAKDLARLRENPGIVLPPGFDLKSVDFGTDSHETYSKKIERAHTSTSILVLGQNLSTEVVSGSYAAARSQEKVRQDYLEFDEGAWSSFDREHVLKAWASVRFGDPELAPWARRDIVPPEDIQIAAETTDKAAGALVKLIERGVNIDVPDFCTRFKIKLVDKGPPLLPVVTAEKASDGSPKPAPAKGDGTTDKASPADEKPTKAADKKE